MADKCAKEHGFLCANYIGRCVDMFVYEPIPIKPEEHRLEFPDVITIKNNQAKHHKSMMSLDVLAGTKRRDYKKGREIYREYVCKLSRDKFSSKREREYVREIVGITQPGYDIPIPYNKMYKFLELADRLGKKIKVTPYEWCKDRRDGWEYYLELV